MDFMEELAALAKKCKSLGPGLLTEEATKNALIMPFIRALGYDVFDPEEVIPEFTADIGEKKGEKVDYAIRADGKLIMLFECKAYGAPLDCSQCTQLQRYFHVTDAPVAILTDGNRYRFFSDLEAENRMDSKPYMEFVLEDMDERLVPEIRKLSKGKFNAELALSAATELKYTREFKRVLADQVDNPADDFVRFFVSQVYEGKITQHVKERFAPMVKSAFGQFINDRINERLKNAMTENKPDTTSEAAPQEEPIPETESRIVTTEEEIQGHYLIKSLLLGTVLPERVCMRDAISYCSILLDDNNRKPLCRFYFNTKQWKIGVFGEDRSEEKLPITGLDDILPLAERIRSTARMYDAVLDKKASA